VEVSADALNWFTLDPSRAPIVSTLFPTDGTGDPGKAINPILTSSDFAGLDISGVRSRYSGSAGGTGFDLAWAQDANGNSVELPSADYIRIDVLSGRTQIDAVSVVPEPSICTLGFLGFCLFCRRLKKKMISRGQAVPCRCPLCGDPNNCQLCGAGAHKGPCWCASVTFPESLLARIPLQLRNRACICQRCVTAFWREQANNRPKKMGSANFYFDETGLMVFTAAYHLRRGYCCGNNCRHCPYRN